MTPGSVLDFRAIYKEHFRFVWRSLRGLGVPEAQVDDAVQEVFLVAYRRLQDFEGRSSVRTWLFGIVQRVASHVRRSAGRKGPHTELNESLEDMSPSPAEHTERFEAMRRLERLLERMDEEKRTVFVLTELEGMTAPEIADMLDVKLNTVYSRLRLARQQFERAVRTEERGES